jgi:hypothetical protein
MGAQAGKLSVAERTALIERYLAGESMTRLAPEFGVTRQAIGGLLCRRGIPVRPQAKLTEMQRVEAAQRYIRGQTCEQIAADFGVSGVAILGVLNRRGVPVRRRCTVWHNAFDEITPESAYWCGFLFADGNVHRRSLQQQPVLSVGVAARDLQQIVKLRSFLGSTHKICWQQETSLIPVSCGFHTVVPTALQSRSVRRANLSRACWLQALLARASGWRWVFGLLRQAARQRTQRPVPAVR